jgi:hypothetical protein
MDYEDFEADEFNEDYTDPLERWEDDCGYDPTFPGICHHVGTEDCSFFCPFHAVYFADKKES